jgi:hypothetical protein
MRISHSDALIKINELRCAFFAQENQQNQKRVLRRNAPRPTIRCPNPLIDVKARVRLQAHLSLPRIARKRLGCAGIHGRS